MYHCWPLGTDPFKFKLNEQGFWTNESESDHDDHDHDDHDHDDHDHDDYDHDNQYYLAILSGPMSGPNLSATNPFIYLKVAMKVFFCMELGSIFFGPDYTGTPGGIHSAG